MIYLDRRNDVKHAISRITARRLKDSTGRWNRYDGDDRLEPFAVDFEDFQTRLDAVEAEKGTIAEYVGRLDRPLLHLDYEDLLARPTETFNRVLAYLGLPPAPLQAATRKNTNDDLREVVTNFAELRARYEGTRYEPMFDEVLVP
jgi:LPS sulfotransferase NodH